HRTQVSRRPRASKVLCDPASARYGPDEDDLMRLFVGIAITDEIRNNIADYVLRLEKALPEQRAKWVRPESLHVTLKFIGERQKLAEIEEQLQAVKSPAISMRFGNVGFFTPQKPTVFWAGVEAGPELEKLATSIEERLYSVGVPKESHAYQEYQPQDRKSTRLNSSHSQISYAVFCLK